MLLKGQKEEITLKLTAKVEQDAGKTIPVRFTATYKKPSVEETKAVIASFEGEEGRDDLEVALEWIVGFGDIFNIDDQPVDFSPENLAIVMNVREYRKALIGGLSDILYGKGIAKNS